MTVAEPAGHGTVEVMAVNTRPSRLLLAAFAVLAALVLAACETDIADHNRSMARTNELRAGARAAALQTNVHLINTADAWARRLRDEWVRGGCGNRSAVLRHTPNLTAHHQPQHVSKNWRVLGENVGVGSVAGGNRAAAIDSLHRAYVASPTHRANMVNPRFRWTGHAVVYGPTASQLAAGHCRGTPANSVAWSVQAYVG